jgi:uncharacterized protein YpmB
MKGVMKMGKREGASKLLDKLVSLAMSTNEVPSYELDDHYQVIDNIKERILVLISSGDDTQSSSKSTYGVSDEIIAFVKKNVQEDALCRVRIDRIEALSKKLAYRYCQSRKGNDYSKVQEDIVTTLRRLRSRPEFYKHKKQGI